MALDYLGLKIGMEYQAIQICDDDRDRAVRYIPAIKFHKVIPLLEVGEDRVQVKELRPDPIRSYSKCHSLLPKEYVYTLMQVTDLEKHALGDGMVVW